MGGKSYVADKQGSLNVLGQNRHQEIDNTRFKDLPITADYLRSLHEPAVSY